MNMIYLLIAFIFIAIFCGGLYAIRPIQGDNDYDDDLTKMYW